MTEVYHYKQDNWLNSHVTILINNAYTQFKNLFPDEEPYWQIRCLKKRKDNVMSVQNWRSDNQDEKINLTFKAPDLIPVKMLEKTQQIYKKINKKTFNPNIKSSARFEEQPRMKSETILKKVEEEIKIKEELFIKCPFETGSVSVSVVTSEPTEVSLIKMESHRVETERFDLWSKNPNSAMIFFKEGDSFDIPFDSHYDENVAKILQSCKVTKPQALQVLEVIKKMSDEKQTLRDEVLRLQKEINKSMLDLRQEILFLKDKYNEALKYATIDDNVLDKEIKTKLGNKRVKDIVDAYISVQVKLNECKTQLLPKLKKVKSVDFDSDVKQMGFIRVLTMAFEDIWDRLLELGDQDESDYDDYS